MAAGVPEQFRLSRDPAARAPPLVEFENCVGNREIESREFQRTGTTGQCRQYCLEAGYRDPTFLDQIDALNQTDWRNVNQISGCNGLLEGLPWLVDNLDRP